MQKKTEISQAPTNATQKSNQSGASSLLISKKRQMFQSLSDRQLESVNKNDIIQQDGIKLIPKNVILYQPNHSRSITWPQVYMPDEQIYVSLKGNFYSIKDSRNKQRFINRNSKPHAQIIYFNVEKNGQIIIISSVQKFILKHETKPHELWYHFSIINYSIQQEEYSEFFSIQKGFLQTSQTKTAANLNAKAGQAYFLEFKGLQLIDNYKKAFVVFQPIGRERNRYYIIMLDFCKNNNGSVKDMLAFSNKQSSASKKVGIAYLERKQTQNFLKMINSEYGDIVLLITSGQIYQIQIAGQFKANQYSLILKPLVICKIFSENKNTYISNQTNQLVLSKQIFKKEEIIIDSQYIMNGLKIMVLTSHGRIFVIESQQCLFSESLYEVLSHKQMIQNYNIQHFVFKKIYFLRGLLVVQVQSQKKQDCNLLKQIRYEQSILQKLDQKNVVQYISRGLLIAKVQSNSLSFNKFISLPFDLKQFEFFRVQPFKEADQILLQAISQKDLQTLELHRCQILSNKNSFIPFNLENYIKQPKISINLAQNMTSIQREVDAKGQTKISFGKSNKSLYLLKGNQISVYRIHSNQFVSSLPNGIQKTMSVSFFQKPQKVIANPLTGYVIVLFRQFVKFFINTYSELKLFHVINIRNVCDISFSKYGEYIVLCMSDNTIHLINSYNFEQTKIMDFYGDIKQALFVSQYILSVKSNKNILNIFKKKITPVILHNNKGKGETIQYYDKLYDIKLDSQDIYHVDETNTVIVKKDGFVEFYSHIPEDRTLKSVADQKQIIKLGILAKQHRHLINKKKFQLQKGESPTYLFYSSQWTTLFVGTSFGKIRQYLYPFLSIEDPSPPAGYNFSVANSSIIHIEINADFSSIYAVSELGQILQFRLTQYLNGFKKNAIYTLSKTQVSETELKYQFANRNYLMDDFTTISEQEKNSIRQQYDEVCFIDDKIKDDVQQLTNKIKNQSHKNIDTILKEKKVLDLTFKQQFNHISSKLKYEEKSISQQLSELMDSNNQIKEKLIEQYQKKLLDIYKQSDRLTAIFNTKTKQFDQETIKVKQENHKTLLEEIQLRQSQSIKLQQHYEQISNKYATYKIVASTEVQQNKFELDTLRKVEIRRVQEQLKAQQLKKQGQLSKIGKNQKQIQRFKKRGIYFENLIVQTRNQIEELQKDISLYDQKKTSLQKELDEKETIIEDKQKQIVKFLKNTNQMKKVKNVHEFQLNQFQDQIIPIHQKIKELETQVQKMNFQIMQQFDNKVQQNSVIQTTKKRIEKLKQKNKFLLDNLLSSRTTLLRFTQSLQGVLADPFSLKVRQKLARVLDKYSSKNQVFVPNEELQLAKKQGQKLIRRKNILRKAIEQQEKLEQGILRNKNQFFRYYVDNTNVVKQYNQLFKDHNLLLQQKKTLEDIISKMKQDKSQQTPLKKRSASLQIRKISQKKLTPFQRYQQEQFEYGLHKVKDTTETRATGEQSQRFLKSLIKDVSISQSSYQKANMIRDRIRTFVNPQLQRKKQIQKQLFQRQRGKSNNIPVLKL